MCGGKSCGNILKKLGLVQHQSENRTSNLSDENFTRYTRERKFCVPKNCDRLTITAQSVAMLNNTNDSRG